MNEAVVQYWLAHYVTDTDLCALCGNRGRIDTTASARSPLGVPCGRVNFCICPNGQTLRAAHDPPPSSTAPM